MEEGWKSINKIVIVRSIVIVLLSIISAIGVIPLLTLPTDAFFTIDPDSIQDFFLQQDDESRFDIEKISDTEYSSVKQLNCKKS